MMDPDKISVKKFLLGRISSKLIIVFLLITLLVGLVGYTAINQLNSVSDVLRTKITEKINVLYGQSYTDLLSQSLRYNDEVMAQSVRSYALTGSSAFRDRYFNSSVELGRLFNFSFNEADLSNRQFFLNLHKQSDELRIIETKAIELSAENKKEDALYLLDGADYTLKRQKFDSALKNFITIRSQEHMQNIVEAKDSIDVAITETLYDIVSTIKVIILVIFSVLSIALMLNIFFSQLITSPIEKLYKATQEVEKGNFKVRVDIKTGDELEILANAFNKSTKIIEQRDEEHKQLEKAKTEFLSITSHELRSPMTPMRAQLQMLTQGYFGKLNKKQRESLDIVLRNTERLDRILLDFLEISRIEAARLKFNFIKTSLAPHIQRLITEMRAFFPEKKISLVANIGRLPIMEVDPDRVMQVLRNLVNNAIKFSPEGSKIIIDAKAVDDAVLISVKDQGIGISTQDQKKIFEPFFQVEKTLNRKYQGTGLGLAICRGIVESQHGSIWFESQLGEGTTFFFTIPFKPTKDIKPIKLLFSPENQINNKLKVLFKDFLGPLGEQEFNILDNKRQTSKQSLIEYIDYLILKGILEKARAEEFKYMIKEIYSLNSKNPDNNILYPIKKD
jgi:signal transduction histidine kinase